MGELRAASPPPLLSLTLGSAPLLSPSLLGHSLSSFLLFALHPPGTPSPPLITCPDDGVFRKLGERRHGHHGAHVPRTDQSGVPAPRGGPVCPATGLQWGAHVPAPGEVRSGSPDA